MARGVADAAEELIALSFASGDVWTALADARSNLNDEAAAAEAYAQAVALAPDQAMLRRNYANSLIALGRLDEAASHLDTAETLDPDSPYLALRRAELAKSAWRSGRSCPLGAGGAPPPAELG